MIHTGDCRDVLPTLPDGSVHCVVTSPPYWGLRDYGVDGQIGLEPTPEAYIETMRGVFRQVWRVLRDDGTLWLNMGDAYNGVGRGEKANGRQKAAMAAKQRSVRGLKPKDLVGMPWRLAFALQADGWYLRSDIIWAKGLSFCPSYAGSVMPESVTDRPTKAHEYLFLLTKSPRYYYDAEAVREAAQYGRRDWARTQFKGGATGRAIDRRHGGSSVTGGDPEAGRNLRTVWTINPKPFTDAHFATFPPALVEPCVKAGTSEKGCCSKCGAPWVRQVNSEFVTLANRRETRKAVQPGADMADVNSRNANRRTTSGWESTCTHYDRHTEPSTVLDPFSGSGTTGIVAKRLGREFVGIELNPAYVSLAERDTVGPLFCEA